MFRALAAVAALACMLSCSEPGDTASAANAPPRAPPVTEPIDVQSFDAAQQTDIRAIVRDYLVRDPTVLREALEMLAATERSEREAEIVSDPRSFSLGPADAPITIVEFFDYRCPYCHAAMTWVFEAARTRRDVRIVFKELPVLSPQSAEAARAAIASIRQGRYAQFHQALMSHRGPLESANIDAIARASGVDVARMRRDMEADADEIDAILTDNHQLASESGITGTPAFLINGEWVRGWPQGAEREMNAKLDAAAARVREARN